MLFIWNSRTSSVSLKTSNKYDWDLFFRSSSAIQEYLVYIQNFNVAPPPFRPLLIMARKLTKIAFTIRNPDIMPFFNKNNDSNNH